MFHLPSSLKIIKDSKTFGQFEIEGLYPGYGITIGNALRRVLLSSIEGAAVTSFQIKGINHEFSAIPYVQETALDIMLNLKQLRVKLYSQEHQILKLIAKGKKKVYASDFQPNSNVEIMNPDLLLATLTDKRAALDMQVTVERGLGYVRVEERKKEKLPIGTIAVDAIFTPVRKVNFEVENMRVGKRTDFNRLLLSIETDGSVTPKEALSQAAAILEKHFQFIQEGILPSSTVKAEVSEDRKKKEPKEIPVEELDLSPRTKGILEDNNIKTLAGLLRYRKENLAKMKGLGKKSLEEIKEVLKGLRYTLK